MSEHALAPKPLSGKVAVVTGGSRGIGRAIGLELARQGASVAFNYLRHHQEARDAQAEIESSGVQCLCQRADLADAKAIEGFFKLVADKFGFIHALVNNAASGVQRPLLELEEKHWQWALDVNARAAWLCAKSAVPIMPPGGSIVNITSLGSQRVFTNYFSVGVSKAALEAVTRYLAVELAPRGIRANAVSGGLVMTDALSHFPNKDEMIRTAVEKTPAGRMVTAEDIARVVAFLCLPASEMIRGQTIVVDGGWSLTN